VPEDHRRPLRVRQREKPGDGRQTTVAAIVVAILLAVSGGNGFAALQDRPNEAAAPSSGESPANAPEALFEQGRRAQTGEEAEAAYRSLLERFPDHPLADDALFALGMQHYSLGYLRTSEREFARVFEEYPGGDRVEDAGYWHGVVLLALGQLDASMERFSWVMDQYPSSEKSAWSRIGIADCLRLQGDFSRAAQAYQEILDRFPSADLQSATLFHLAEVYESLEDVESARPLYEQLSEAYPHTYEGVQAIARLMELPPRAPASLDSLQLADLGEEIEEGVRESTEEADLPEETLETEPRDTWMVQVGAFAMQENAERLVRVLAAHGYPDVRIELGEISSQTIHRVLVGKFLSDTEAGSMARILRERHHLETRVFKRFE
jgi:TolA-binding protein